MAVLIPQTREELALSIGYALGAVQKSTATSAGSTSTFIDSSLKAADDYLNGKWWRGADTGTNRGAIRQISDYDGTTTTGTLRGDVLGAAVGDGDTYELWDEDFHPDRIHDFINRAIRAVPRRAAPPLANTSIWAHRGLYRYTVPTAVKGIHAIEYRADVTNVLIDNCDSVWDELVDGDVTATATTKDKRQGSAANKFVLAAGLGAGDVIAANNPGTLDLSGMTHVELLIKSTVATSAADLQLILSTTASAGTETELLDIPALTADTWTYCRIALANPESDSAIISVGLKHTVDIGAATIHVDAIRAIDRDSEFYKTLHRNYWWIDRDNREIRFRPEANGLAGDTILQLRGRANPTELTADATECDIEPEYIIEKALSHAFRSRGYRKGDNRDAAYIEAERHDALALVAIQSQQTPGGMRWVDTT